MTRARVWLLFALFTAGCRAVLGVEDLTLDEDGGGTAGGDGGEGGADGAAAETSADAAPDAPATDAAADVLVNTCVGQQDCRRCCRETAPYNAGFPILQDTARQQGCICNLSSPASSCQTTCATEACATPPQMPQPACGKCIDDIYRQAPASCSAAFAACRQNASCAAALDCIQACP